MNTSTYLNRFIHGSAAALLLATGFPAFADKEILDAKGPDKNPPILEQAAPQPRWYFSLGAGTDFDLDSAFVNGVDEDFNNVLPFNAATAPGGIFIPGKGPDGSGNLHIRNRDFHDAYDDLIRINAELGYRINDYWEVFLLFKYTHADANTLSGSSLTIDFDEDDGGFPFPGGDLRFDFVSRFDDYDAYGGEIGARFFFFQPESRIRPYISVQGGATYVEQIDANVWVLNPFIGDEVEGGLGALDIDFYSASVVGTVAGLFGAEFKVTERFSITADIGLRYYMELCDDDDDLNDFSEGGAPFGLDLESVNNEGYRLAIPVTISAKFRF